MVDVEARYLEFVAGVAGVEVLAHTIQRDNTRWRDLRRERRLIDLEVVRGIPILV